MEPSGAVDGLDAEEKRDCAAIAEEEWGSDKPPPPPPTPTPPLAPPDGVCAREFGDEDEVGGGPRPSRIAVLCAA